MTPPPVHACAVCKRVLDYDSGAGEHRHVYADEKLGHDPVPVPVEELDDLIARCDFCQADDPSWTLPVRDFAMPVVSGHASNGDWAACAPCAKLIERNAWNALLRRVQAQHEQHYGQQMLPEVYASLQVLYRTLRKNISGAIKPTDSGG